MKFALWLLGGLFYQTVGRNPTNAIETYQRYTSCEDGWYQYGNKCYRVFAKYRKDWTTWEEARDACIKRGAQLASIHSIEENDFLVAYLQYNTEYSFWVGLNDHVVDKKYEWYDKSAVSFTNWDRDEPSKGDEDNCVEVRLTLYSAVSGKWNALPCNVRLPYLCQMPTDSSISNENPKYCPEGRNGFSLLASCYTYVNSLKTWADAEFFCRKNFGGHLAAIPNDLVQNFLTYALKELEIPTSLWIGLKGFETETVPLWSSGWYLSYTNWVNGNQQLKKGTCVSFMSDGRWIVMPCDGTLPFICEVSQVVPGKLELVVKGAYCPTASPDWKDLGGEYCYYFNTVDKVDFKEANYQCLRRGGTLASIHSRTELESIWQFLRYRVWSVYIGLIQQYDNKFSWVDKSELDFQNWADNEPNSNDENCAELIVQGDSMTWNDVACNVHLPYVCSAKKKPPNIFVQDEVIFCSGEMFTIQ